MIQKILSKKGKYVNVGVGSNQEEDSYQSAKLAAEEAVKECGKTPTFSFVYVDSRHDPEKVAKGINEVLGKNWVGCSTDRQFSNKLVMSEGKTISVMSISSEYLHFGVGAEENYRKNPEKAGKNAITNAINYVKKDGYIDPYVQFRRAQTKTFQDIIRVPPYFIITYMSGSFYKNKQIVLGKENEFLSGIADVVGVNIPIFGSVSNSDFDAFMKDGIATNWQFAEGKVLYDGGIVIFVSSSLEFSYALEHGYKETNVGGLINKVKDGHILEEINGKPAIDEYCRIIGVPKEEFVKDPYKYTLSKSLALVDMQGNTYIRAMGATPDGKFLFSQAKIPQRVAFTVVDFDHSNVVSAISKAFKTANPKKNNIGFALVSSCSARRALLGKDIKNEVSVVSKNHGKFPFIGFYTFGEIGSNLEIPSQLNEQTVTLLVIYDKLLSE